ncbi:tail fiber domain-containing protein [Microscilla marina]|uniref:Cell wall surface anchor family protein n=1 Tax=Microscilla marina ATCC 23134 TaxID=313606 RepID=A2A0M5_MICM2|nr:tail fiber domain-containing protein [Microscilla marina]EAY23814.1 cell wall surface anchor family protein [Microscilla marina ATCC 23134]
MKKHNSILVTLSLMAFFALGMGNISQAQTSRLTIKKPGSSTGVTLDNETGGNTIFSIGSSEKMRLTSDGKLGIGTTDPQDKLHIGSAGLVNIRVGKYVHLGETGNGLATVLGNNVRVSTTENVKMQFVNPIDGGQAIRLMFNEGISFHTAGGVLTGDVITAGQNYAGYERMRIDLNGNVGIGTTTPAYKLEVDGNIHATERVYANGIELTSDIRYKKNIQPLSTDVVAKLSQVRGTSYKFRTEEFKEKRFLKTKQVGIIAQELAQVYPELVMKGADGYYSVNYIGLIPILVEAVKDLRKNNDKLDKQAQVLKAKNKKIKEALTGLKSQHKNLKAELADVKSQHKALKAELNDLKSRLKAIEKSLEKPKD